MRVTVSLILLVTVVLLGAACGGDDSTNTPGPQLSTTSDGVSVTRGGQPLAAYSSADEAFARASKEAGFQVLPVRQLPEGFKVASINVLDPPAGVQTPLRHVEIGIRSNSGGAMLTELNTRSDPGPQAVRVTSTSPGDYFASPDAKTFTRLTNDRTFTLALQTTNLSQAEAIEVLASIR